MSAGNEDRRYDFVKEERNDCPEGQQEEVVHVAVTAEISDGVVSPVLIAIEIERVRPSVNI